MTQLLKPASRKQEMFINSESTITVFGGAAGSGKSYMGLMDLLKYTHLKKFRGVVFRRTTPQLKGVGGMWDVATSMYGDVYKRLSISTKDSTIVFPSGARISMRHMEYVKDKYNIQGWQIGLALVDEATQFEEEQISYIIGRLRSNIDGVPSRIKMTCNPDYDSFLRIWLEKGGYLDKEGFPIEEMCGVEVYCGRVSNEMEFEPSLELWEEKYPHVTPFTFTFINATCQDNPILLEAEPDYISKLQNLSRVERDRLLHGNWYAREEASGYWKREWCGNTISLYELPPLRRVARSWDMAASLPSEVYPDPDYTVGLKGGIDEEGSLYILGLTRFRDRPAGVISKLMGDAETDGHECTVTIPKDPGAAGKAAADHVASKLFEGGFTCRQMRTSKSKTKRFEPVSAMGENGMIKIVKSRWNDVFHSELEAFGTGRGHDDIVDAISDLAEELCNRKAIPDFECPDGLTQHNPFSTDLRVL